MISLQKTPTFINDRVAGVKDPAVRDYSVSSGVADACSSLGKRRKNEHILLLASHQRPGLGEHLNV